MICPICGQDKDPEDFDQNGICYDCESAMNTAEEYGMFDELGGI